MSESLDIPAGFRMERGLLWPAMDEHCASVIFRTQHDLDVALPHVRSFDACVQAGGNCGVWPRALATKFKRVYTAEPHPLNFTALAWNTAGLDNVIRLQCAFGSERGFVRLQLAEDESANCGAYFVADDGHIPTLLIDDLGLRSCGLICLDIEGYEMKALQGAQATIRACHPVIVIEDKGLSKKYGTRRGDCEKWLESTFGYVVAERVRRDVVLVHAASAGRAAAHG
jgi:FkbM family methyltransferase